MGSAWGAVGVVGSACREVQASKMLLRVFRSTLTVGNVLNSGSHRGNATGIKLDSLMKLADIKVKPSPAICLPPLSALRQEQFSKDLMVIMPLEEIVCERPSCCPHCHMLPANFNCKAIFKLTCRLVPVGPVHSAREQLACSSKLGAVSKFSRSQPLSRFCMSDCIPKDVPCS